MSDSSDDMEFYSGFLDDEDDCESCDELKEKLRDLKAENNELRLKYIAAASGRQYDANFYAAEKAELQKQLHKYKDRFDDAIEGTVTAYKFKVSKLKAENEGLREYRDKIYDYVQGTGNTSSKFLGHHVADALVNDHKLLKKENAKLHPVVKVLRGAISLAVEYLSSCGYGVKTADREPEDYMIIDLRQALTETEKILGGEDDKKTT